VTGARGAPDANPERVQRAEQVLVAAALSVRNDPGAVLAATALPPELFQTPAFREVWGAITALVAQGAHVSAITVCRQLQSTGALAALGTAPDADGAPSEEAWLLDQIGRGSATVRLTAATVPAYAAIVREAAVAREGRRVLEATAEGSLQAPDLAAAGASLTALAAEATPAPPEMTDEDVLRAIDHGPPDGMLTFPWLSLTDATDGGVVPGEAVTLGAVSGCGKTTWALQWADHVARVHGSALYVSAEMGVEALRRKVLSARTGIPLSYNATCTLDQRQRLGEAARAAWAPRLRIVEAHSIAQIEAGVRRVKAKVPDLRLVVVDFLQNLSHEGGRSVGRVDQLGDIMGRLHRLAKALSVVVCVVVQLNGKALQLRAGGRNDEPTMWDIQNTSVAGQLADFVLLLHRPAPSDTAPVAATRGAEVVVIGGKVRRGAQFRYHYLLDGATSRVVSHELAYDPFRS
jgi:replicative DNA helicase